MQQENDKKMDRNGWEYCNKQSLVGSGMGVLQRKGGIENEALVSDLTI